MLQNESTPTVFVVDDDPGVRESLTMMIQNMNLAVECFSSADHFLSSGNHDQPGCLVLDIRMPGISGIELQERLLAEDLPRSIIFITGAGDVPMSVRAMKNGAIDFLEKPYSPRQLAQTIRQAIEVNIQRRQDRASFAQAEQQLARLSDGEREVMLRIVAGEISKDIARELEISLRTVEYRKASLMKKLNVHSRSALVTLAGRLQLTQLQH